MASITEILMNPVLIVVVVFIFTLILYSLRSYFSALISSLFYDYVIDAGFSFADELLGIGIAGVDVGDWIAAGILFLKYRKKVGNVWALIFAAEASNFLLSFIPGIGEGIEFFFNLFPLVTLVILYKQYQATGIYNGIKEYDDYLKQENGNVEKKMKAQVDNIHELYEKQDYQELKNLGDSVKESLHAQTKLIIEDKLINIEKQISMLPREQQAQFQQAVDQIKQDMDTNWREAVQYADELLNQVSSLAYQAQSQATGQRAA
ncbi:hypothetical protein COV16_03685 [Candidatus Woesearchaeota archaeon CG10_big_fil_rev_8_21_14_0_10_34_8]|nr:MAG: hypothetical protein COV16_03685 [Candidatus Woesearchaeota archaeon CG10_big_fil_rev_8_21_14_0_10_34_8]